MFSLHILFFIFAALSLWGEHKVVLINDTSLWYHWGCTGTSTALKEGIHKLGFGIESIPINEVYALKNIPSFEDFNDPEQFEYFCKENRSVIDAIQHADAVVITGEGTIHGLGKGPKTLLYLAHISKKFFQKHVEIINHSAYPKDNPILSSSSLEKDEEAQAVYQTIYSELDYIAIREPFSQTEMKKLGILSSLSFDCLPLYIENHYQKEKHINRPTIVVAGSVAFTETAVKKLCRYIEEMSQRGFEIKVLIGAAGYPAKDDQSFIHCLKKYCITPWELIKATSMEEWLDTINDATFLVSGRFHHSIAAFCLNTPFIALNSNTYKVHGLCALLGEEEPLLFSDPNLVENLFQRTKLILSSPRVNNTLKRERISRSAERNFDGLKLFNEKYIFTLQEFKK